MRTIRTPFNERAFLDALTDGDSPTRACRRVGLARSAVYLWRATDPAFAAKWERSLEMGIDALEDECIQRAMDGSDMLLTFMLRARRPDKFRDCRSLDVHGNSGDIFRRMPTDELRERLDQLRREQNGADLALLPPDDEHVA
jgi:hypothetical protein